MRFFTSPKVMMVIFIFCIWGTRDVLADFDGDGFIAGSDLSLIVGASD